MAKAFNVETRFKGMEMIHVFNDDLMVVTDLGTLESRVLINGNEVRKTNCSGMTLSLYEQYLKEITENIVMATA